MNTPASSLRYPAAVALLATILSSSTALHAATFNWTGGFTNGAWSQTGNWDTAPTFNNQADLVFNTTTRTLATSGQGSFLNGSRTIRSLSFGADIDAGVSISLNFFNATNGVNLTLSADTGNASVNVDSGATGAITIGVGAGMSSGFGNIILSSDVDVAHNGSGLLTFNRVVSGTGKLNKSGTGTLTFTGTTNANTYSGLTTVSGGGLTLNKTAGTDAIAGDLLVNGTGTVTLSAANQIKDTSNVEIAAGTFAMGANAETVNGLKLNGGSITGSGALTSATTFDLQSGSASAALTGSVGANKTTSGDVTLSGANALTGTLAISEGKVIAAAASATAADISSFGAISLAAGTTLEIRAGGVNKNYAGAANITISGASTITYNNTGVSNFTGTLGGTGTLILNDTLTLSNISDQTQNNVFNIARDLSGTGDLIISVNNDIASASSNFSSRRVQLQNANAGWSGNTTILSGAGQLTVNGTFGSGTVTIGQTGNALGAGIQLNLADGSTKTVANNLIVTSGGFRGFKGNSLNMNTDFTGNVDLQTGSTFSVDHSKSTNSQFVRFSGNISGAGALSVTRIGTTGEAVRLTGTNNYSGGTTIGTGASLFVGQGGTTGSITGNVLNDGALQFSRSNDLSFAGDISGAGTFAKAGAGSLTLTGANSFSGGTTVSVGGLIVNGALSNASNTVTVASAAALGGDGSIAGAISFASGANYIFNTTATLDVTGAVTFGGFGISNLLGLNSGTIAATYLLLNGTGSNIDFTNVSNVGIGNALDLGAGTTAYFDIAGGDLSVVVTGAIPEPSSFALLGGLVALGFVGSRRRRAS